jgi:hypothetical protein
METEAFFQNLAGRLKIPGGDILTYEEIQDWPPGMREALEKAGKIRQIEPAAEVICNQCEERCLIIPELSIDPETEEKVWFSVCPEKPDIGRIQVEPEQRMRWEIIADKKKPEPVAPKVAPAAIVDVADQKLTPANEAAYQSYCLAEKTLGKCTDKEAYAWLKEHGPEEGYDLPPFATWQKYVRNGRKYYKTNKNTPRSGRKPSAASVQDDPDILSEISNQYSRQSTNRKKAD